MELWLLTGLIVCLASASFNTFQKHLVGSESVIDVAYHTNLVASILLLIPASYMFIKYGFEPVGIVFILFTGILNAFTFYLFPLALSKQDLGVIAPTRGLTPIMIGLIEPLLFTLQYRNNLIIASVLAGFGLYVAFSEDGLLTPIQKIKSEGVWFAIASAIFLSGAILTDRVAVHSFDAQPQVYAFGLALTTTLFLGMLRYYRNATKSFVPTKRFLPVGIARAVTVGVGVFTLNIATGTEFNILIQLAIPISILLGWVFLGEREFTSRQLVGSLLIIIGICIML